MKNLILLFMLFAFNLEAETFYITNGLILRNKEIKKIEMYNTTDIKKNKVSQAEVLYGKYENIDLLLLISREYKDSGYLINYNRFKIDSYPVNNIKVFNSAYGNDKLNSNLYFLLLDNLLLNLNLGYIAETSGTMHNPTYNNQSKRDLVFSPTFKYAITEKSFIKSIFQYNDFYINFESSYNEYYIQNSFFDVNLEYSHIWSKINSFSFYLDVMQTEYEINNLREINSIAIIKANDKFALSKKLIFTLGLSLNLNKKYNFVFNPSIKILYMLKNFNFTLSYLPKYEPLYYKKILENNKFIKIIEFPKPFIVHPVKFNVNISLFKTFVYSIVLKYSKYINYPSIIYDIDDIFFIKKINTENFLIENKFRYKPAKWFDLTASYNYTLYQQASPVELFCKNYVSITTEIYISSFIAKVKLNYYDVKNFLDKSNNRIRLKSNIVMKFDFSYKINESLGVNLELENYNKNGYYKLPYYPEYENLIKLGIYTGF